MVTAACPKSIRAHRGNYKPQKGRVSPQLLLLLEDIPWRNFQTVENKTSLSRSLTILRTTPHPSAGITAENIKHVE